MDREEILSKSKKDNSFLDECEQQNKLKGQAIALLFTTMVCILIFLIKLFTHQGTADIAVILLAILFSVMAYRAYSEKSKTNLVIAVFSFGLMLYTFIEFILAV